MILSKIMAVILVMFWLLYFSRAVFNVIKGLLYWLVFKPTEQITKWLFGE